MKQEAVNELLKPRYEVIAESPNNPERIGDIFHQIYDDGIFHLINREHQSVGYHVMVLDNYPHLFRKLEWWEHRKPEEMPEYLKSVEISPDPHYVKVTKHYSSFFEGQYQASKVFKPYWESPYNLYIPATELEYTNYINQK